VSTLSLMLESTWNMSVILDPSAAQHNLSDFQKLAFAK